MMEIRNRKDLELFRERVNNGERKVDAVLLNDLDLSYSPDWEPIGDLVKKKRDSICFDGPDMWYGYEGCFDGLGHTISGFYIYDYNKAKIRTADHFGINAYGFFARAGGNAEIRNLTVEGSIVGRNNVGGIVGHLTDGKIINCTNRVNCKGQDMVAGIVGFGRGLIDNCVNYGTIEANNPYGIVGSNIPHEDFPTTIKNCRNEGELIVSERGRLFSQYIVIKKALSANHYRYNQIADIRYPNSDKFGGNKQNGKVVYPFQNSLVGMYLKERKHSDDPKDVIKTLIPLLQADSDTKHRNEAGDTYLHIICQTLNPDLKKIATYEGIRQLLPEIIVTLAEETELEFDELNKNGKNAASFLRDSKTGRVKRGFLPIVKLIDEIRCDKNKEENNDYSDIGF